MLFYVLFVCKCVLYCCHRVATQSQLKKIIPSSSRPHKMIFSADVLRLHEFCHVSHVFYMPAPQSSHEGRTHAAIKLASVRRVQHIWHIGYGFVSIIREHFQRRTNAVTMSRSSIVSSALLAPPYSLYLSCIRRDIALLVLLS